MKFINFTDKAGKTLYVKLSSIVAITFAKGEEPTSFIHLENFADEGFFVKGAPYEVSNHIDKALASGE